MRALVQGVHRAEVEVEGDVVGRIDAGLLVYVGIGTGATGDQARKLAEKVAGLRIFKDEAGKLNRSVRDVDGAVLAVPNFTLMGDARRGRRPAFTDAARPEKAEPLYEVFLQALADRQCRVESGVFRASMVIRSAAAGPVNLVIDMT